MWTNTSVPQSLKLEHDYDVRVEFPLEGDGHSTLRIKNLTESDSGEYRFKFITQDFEWMSGLPGTNLTVAGLRVHANVVKEENSLVVAQLSCEMNCTPELLPSFCWSRNGRQVAPCATFQTTREITLNPGDYVTCGVEGHPLSVSPRLYALSTPSVLLSDSHEILEGNPLTLKCSTDTTSAEHRWYKKIRPSNHKFMTYGLMMVFSNVSYSDSAEYFCTVENELGKKTSEPVVIDVKFPPRFSSLWVSPSNVVKEGQSVNLNCSSDANPAASYTWYKDNQIVLQGTEIHYRFTFIRSEDAGSFYCKAQNKYGHITSSTVFIDVQYAPRLLRTFVALSSKVTGDRWLTLTCRSDANPVANYTWYKDNSPVATGQNFSIRPEDVATYVCEARNSRGLRRITVYMDATLRNNIIRLSVVVVLLIVVLLLALCMRNMTSPSSWTQPNKQRQPKERHHGDYENIYATVQTHKHQQEDTL
ncbi:B-cell receptor CD22-like [Syngnathoides biaculeatus]|uniref:B-cell receptor CD22-like n=1 Tax=Syngnathoides biaculeatus TaxID=300417 RepID=UPI002ADDF7A2|nr:B-cell receptor CD22-like [Syngnathoides biaculeatus]